MKTINLALLYGEWADPADEGRFKAAVLAEADDARTVNLTGPAPTFLYCWATAWLKDAGVTRLWVTSPSNGAVLIWGRKDGG